MAEKLVTDPSGTVMKNKKMLKLINHETHGTHEMDEDQILFACPQCYAQRCRRVITKNNSRFVR